MSGSPPLTCPDQGWGMDGLISAVLGQKCDFCEVLGLARNPPKKMRLYESFRMVQSACQSDATIKSYGQITELILCMFMSNVGPDVRRPDVDVGTWLRTA